MTLKFAKKLPTLGIHYKAIPDPEPTLPEGLLPDLPDPTRGIDTSLFQGLYLYEISLDLFNINTDNLLTSFNNLSEVWNALGE